MHFGLHLKKNGTISAEQLVAALEVQLSTLVPIGQLALEEGMLAARDIFNILRAQGEAPNVLFGDLAIEMGLLTRDDVMRLLMIQADRKRPIGEILVGQGVLSESQLQAELAGLTNRIGLMIEQSSKKQNDNSELLKLRGDVGVLKRQAQTVQAQLEELKSTKAQFAKTEGKL